MAKTIIGGYTVDTEDADEGRIDCFVSKGQYSGSLSALQMTGVLEDSSFSNYIEVPERTQTAIEKWALAQGW